MPSLADLNSCSRDDFVAVVGPVFEHSPWIAASVVDARPFASRDALHAALCAAVERAGGDAQLALIRAHPDLVGRAVLTAASSREQASAGLVDLAPEEVRAFGRYNAEYTARFGFPFVICAREHKKEVILRAFPERLAHTREQEIATALEQIFRIAALRLADAVS